MWYRVGPVPPGWNLQTRVWRDGMDRIIDSIASSRPRPDHKITFYQDDQVVSHTLSDLDALACALATRLRGLGVAAGDRIGILSRNRLEWILLDLAAIKLKVTTAGFDYNHFTPGAELLDAYGLKLIFTDREADLPGIVDIRTVAAGLTPGEGGEFPARYADDDVTTIKFTSGSTGQPKGLGATVASIESSLAAAQSLFHHGPSDTLFVFLPLSLLQQRYWVYSALHYGHDVVVATYELAFYAMKRERPTVIMGVPSFFDAIRKQVESKLRGKGRDDLEERRRRADDILGGRIRYLWTGSAPASPSMLHFFHDCGIPIFEGYGMNETCIVTKNFDGNCKIGSAGKALPGKEVLIGDGGMIIVRSRYPVNRRYMYCAPGESEKIFSPEGDVITGDIGHVDEDGYLFVTGRADDVIALGNGRNVLARPIEEQVRNCGAVGECVLFGAGRAFLTAVVSKSSDAADEGEIAAHIESVNRTLDKDERIGKFIIAKNRFTIENGLLTSQYKPRRKEILKMYQAEMNDAYGGKS